MRTEAFIIRVPRAGPRRRHSGMTIIYAGIVLLVLCAFASLAVDYGRVQLVKTEFQAAADAAARHAARGYTSHSRAHALANEAAQDNLVNGAAWRLASSEVEIGAWDHVTRGFVANGSPRNAVRIHKSMQVPLAFGPMIGMQNCTVRVGSVARCIPISIVGVNSIRFLNNTLVASYDSASNPDPTAATANRNGSIVSNGHIGAMNNGDIRGDVFIGPAGSLASGWRVTGAVHTLPQGVELPPAVTWNPGGGNPGGVSQGTYVHSGNVALNGGIYWFSDLTIDLHSTLTFNGPATVYVNGDVTVRNGGTLLGYRSIPANLKIHQVGSDRSFTSMNNATVTAVVIAPGSNFVSMNNAVFRGACLFETILCMNNAEWFFDETAGEVVALSLVE